MMTQVEIDPIQQAHQTFFFLTNILFPKNFPLRSHIPTTVKAHAGFLGWGMEGDPLKSGSPSPSIGLMSIPEPPHIFLGFCFIQSRAGKPKNGDGASRPFPCISQRYAVEVALG